MHDKHEMVLWFVKIDVFVDNFYYVYVFTKPFWKTDGLVFKFFTTLDRFTVQFFLFYFTDLNPFFNLGYWKIFK